jgi:hypothetical protein
LFASLTVLMQPLGQHVSTDGHAGPPLHVVGAVQRPATQVSPFGHTSLHVPQLRTSVAVFVHPWLQHVAAPVHTGPPLQEGGIWQTPPRHVAPAPHALPQPPQLFESVSMSVQPTVQHWSTPVQRGPPLHDAFGVQTPAMQLLFAGQALPHPLQLFGSVSMSVQPALQHCSRPVQTGPPAHWAGGVQLPCTQVSPALHAKPHWLQLFGSVFTSVQPFWQHSCAPLQTMPLKHVGGGIGMHWPFSHWQPFGPHSQI